MFYPVLQLNIFTLKVTDESGFSEQKECAITITKNLKIIIDSETEETKWCIKKFVSPSLTIVGGIAPYVWTYSGTLPEGIKLVQSENGKEATLQGTLKKAKTYSFTLKVTDKDGDSISKKFSVTVTKPTLSGTLPKNGVIDTEYNGLLSVSGGTEPYFWSVSEGACPFGLTLFDGNTNAILTGKPSDDAIFTFTITVSDKNGATDSKKFTIAITRPKISGDIVANAVVKQPYSSAIKISGGTKPYTWIKSSGTLPKGLELVSNSTGTRLTLKGTPTTAKAYKFTLQATDKNGVTASKKFTVTVTKPVISGDIKASGVVKQSYSSVIKISGGTKPYTWIKSSGTLPKGLELSTNSTGSKLYLKGTPTTAKAYTFTLKATDKNDATASKKFTVTLTKPTISGTLTDSGTINSAYSSSISVSKGTSPYTWTKSKGTLPTGLKLTTNSTGTKLYLKGTPKIAEEYNFALKVADKNGVTASKPFTITIAKATAKSGESEYTLNRTKDLSSVQDVTTPETGEAEPIHGQQSFLKVLSDDILWQGEGKDEDLIGVQANEPLTFIIENAHSDMQVVIDDDKNGDIEIDDGSFTLPAEFVSNDFKIRAENDAVETNELFISVEE